jgi:purine nucleoside permease
MFERGNDSGDEPGELQYWVERNKLDIVLPFPQGYHSLRMNREGVLAILTGVGNTKAAAALMALGLDPRFDLTKAYFLVAGIAGVNPLNASLGSAAWAEWIVDGDLAHEIDAREIPSDWKTGYVPLRQSVPFELPRIVVDGQVFHLNPGLQDWAYNVTRNVELVDTDAMKEERRHFPSPNAQRPPFVLKGDQLAASTFWHGKLLSDWANEWVKYHTEGKGSYVTTAMEDTGTLQSLTYLAKAGRVDINRVMVLRTASDFDQQKPGGSAAESLAQNKLGKYTAFQSALEAAWRVGNTVVTKLVGNWKEYRDHVPQ